MALDSTTEEIRRRADIVEVVGDYVALRPAGNGRFKACCPFHDEKTPSFNISRDKGFYKCFGCGVAGDVFKFVMGMENVSFGDARRMLAERYGVPLPERKELSEEQKQELSERERLWKVMAAAAAFFREQFTGNAGLQARDYARKRGLSRETLEKFGVGYAPDAWDALRHHLTRKFGFSDDDSVTSGLLIQRLPEEGGEDAIGEPTTRPRRIYDRYRHRLMFPIWDESGRVIGFGGRALDGGRFGNSDAKYINSPESPIFHKSNVLFAWHLARPEISKRESVIITEGYMDAIAMHEGGFPNTVATLGTALTAQHVALLRRLSPPVIYLCFDGDSAGMKAALRTAPLFAEHALDVRVVRLPTEHDPDTYIREHGTHGMEAAIREATPLARYRLESALKEKDLSDLSERAEVMRAAAEVIADVASNTEREGYIAWLTDHFANLDGMTTPRGRQYIEAAVRQELGAEQKRTQQTQRKWEDRREWWSKRAGKEKGFTPQDPEQAAAEAHEVAQTLAAVSQGIAPGVLEAEKALISTLLSQPAWRNHILERLPPGKWTTETHFEIVSAISKLPEGLEVVPVEFMQSVSDQAGQLVSEVMLSDDAQDLPDVRVIDDWMARVERHWARQTEMEMLELIRSKVDHGEKVTPEEKSALDAALRATKRKMPVPAKT